MPTSNPTTIFQNSNRTKFGSPNDFMVKPRKMQQPTTQDFEDAGRAALAFLYQKFNFDLWMITRVQGDNWIVLQSEDDGYDVTPGTVFRWSESLCSEMFKRNGPRIAPDATIHPAYVNAPLSRKMPIKSYIGVPLTYADGSLFGTLCAIDPRVQPATICEDQNMIELIASMLSSILSSDVRIAQEIRRSERLGVEALVDPLTRLSNRRAWDQLLTQEEERCRRYGHPAAVLAVDLDQLKHINDTSGHIAGDQYISSAAQAMRAATREVDIVARLGGDEFGIIAVECDSAGADVILGRLRESFIQHDVKASVGLSLRTPSKGLSGAWQEADKLMYVDKRARSGTERHGNEAA